MCVSDRGAEGFVLRSDGHAAQRCTVFRDIRHDLQPGQIHAATRSVHILQLYIHVID